MKTIFRNAVYVGEAANGPQVHRGHVALDADRIVYAGPAIAGFEDFEPIDAANKLVIPGLINAHTHVVLLALRGSIEDIEGYMVYRYMVPSTYLLTPGERAAIATLACAEAIRSGTTTLVDPLRHVEDYAPAMARSGLRLWLAESCADAVTTEVSRTGYRFDRAFGETFLDRTRRLIEQFHGAEDDRVRVVMAGHGPDNCSPWMLEQVTGLARKHGLPRTIHLSQIPSEVEQVRALHGCTSTEYLNAQGFLGPDLMAVHWSFCTESDVETLARTGTHFVHCPASMSAKGPHQLPIKAIRDNWVHCILGTDNMTEDMFNAMRMGLIIHRGAEGRSVQPMPSEVFQFATTNAARALQHDRIGRIAAGMKADLAVLDLNAPALNPRVSIVSNLVHYGHPGMVTDTIVDGRFLMRDGRLVTLDEVEVSQQAQAATSAMWTRFAREHPDVPLPLIDTY
ncbi:MAG: amidohydrolase family protein [Pseudomonadota bacterium]